jgi:hypothetical protein
MHRTRTTVLGVGFILFALLSLGVALLGWMAVRAHPIADPAQQRAFMLQLAPSIGAKVLAVVTGMMLITRSPAALPLLVLTLLVSTGHSLVMQFLIDHPPLPDTFTPAEVTGRLSGWYAAVWLPPILYVFCILYLLMPRSRAEFARGPVPPARLPDSMTTPRRTGG